MSLKLQSKLVAFFAANPDEELLVADAATKFDTSESSVRVAVRALAERRIVNVERLPPSGEMGAPPLVFRAGPALRDYAK